MTDRTNQPEEPHDDQWSCACAKHDDFGDITEFRVHDGDVCVCVDCGAVREECEPC